MPELESGCGAISSRRPSAEDHLIVVVLANFPVDNISGMGWPLVRTWRSN